MVAPSAILKGPGYQTRINRILRRVDDGGQETDGREIEWSWSPTRRLSPHPPPLEKANETGGASLLRVQQATINGMLQKLSGKGSCRIQ
jgi:hypothetical protein